MSLASAVLALAVWLVAADALLGHSFRMLTLFLPPYALVSLVLLFAPPGVFRSRIDFFFASGYRRPSRSLVQGVNSASSAALLLPSMR